jgi:hypothetical protein
MTTIDAVINSLFDRGALPRRIRLLRDRWPVARAGDSFTWDDERRAFLCDAGRDLALRAGLVRDGWGVVFGPGAPEQLELRVA